jgi:monoamine oxidase
MLNPEIRNHTSPRQILELLDIIIIGGGLSGLMVAHEIHHTLPSASWKLLEARPMLGGRLANNNVLQNDASAGVAMAAAHDKIDLGGAWIWPQHQPFMRNLTSSLNIPTFLQQDDPSSTRIDGGAVQYIHALAQHLPQDRLILNSPVIKCAFVTEESAWEDQLCTSTIDTTTTTTSIDTTSNKIIRVQTEGEMLFAKRVVIAAPPRLVAKHIQFDPPLSPAKQRAMASSHTWMAGVTKISLQYETNFWTPDVSNLAFPPPGRPAFQVYDASTKDGSVAALTFFALVVEPPRNNAVTSDDDAVLADQVASQMEQTWRYFRLPFASRAKSYTHVHIKRWPLERYISEDTNPTTIHPHPHPVRDLSTNEWNDHLLFAGSETDHKSPGVMEGAIGAAMRVVHTLQQYFRQQQE